MRDKPATAAASGSTFSASVPLPVGASHSSHAKPSAIRPNVLSSASVRVSRIVASEGADGGPEEGAGASAASGVLLMFGIIGCMSTPSAAAEEDRASWNEEVAQSLDALRAWPWLDTLRTLRRRFREDQLGLTASSLTFTTLIALVPLITVMLALFTAFPVFNSFQVALQKYFVQSLVPDGIAKPVLDALAQFAAKASRLGAVGVVAFAVTALALMLTIDRALNNIWRVRKPRPIAQRVLVYWAAMTLGPLLLGVSITITSLAITSPRGLAATPGSVSLLIDLLQFALMVMAGTGLFRYVPNTYVRWRHALAGGLFVALALELAKRGLGWYVASVPLYTNVYGAFASAPILLLWIYMVWLIVLFGAVIAAYAPSLSMRVARQADVPGQRFALALSVLGLLARARTGERRGLSSVRIAKLLRTDPLQIEPVLETLAALDWIGRLEEEGVQRNVLLCEPASTPAAPLVERLLLDPGVEADPFRERARLQAMSLAELLPA